MNFPVRTAKIPESCARLTVPVGMLKELPAGAAFMQKSGQATAEIRFLHDTLFVYATCDSLQALVYQYEEQLERQSKCTKENNKEVVKKSGLPPIMILSIFSIIVIVIFYKFLPHKSG